MNNHYAYLHKCSLVVMEAKRVYMALVRAGTRRNKNNYPKFVENQIRNGTSHDLIAYAMKNDIEYKRAIIGSRTAMRKLREDGFCRHISEKIGDMSPDSFHWAYIQSGADIKTAIKTTSTVKYCSDVVVDAFVALYKIIINRNSTHANEVEQLKANIAQLNDTIATNVAVIKEQAELLEKQQREICDLMRDQKKRDSVEDRSMGNSVGVEPEKPIYKCISRRKADNREGCCCESDTLVAVYCKAANTTIQVTPETQRAYGIMLLMAMNKINSEYDELTIAWFENRILRKNRAFVCAFIDDMLDNLYILNILDYLTNLTQFMYQYIAWRAINTNKKDQLARLYEVARTKKLSFTERLMNSVMTPGIADDDFMKRMFDIEERTRSSHT